MKVCEHCGDEIFTRDGDNACQKCEDKAPLEDERPAPGSMGAILTHKRKKRRKSARQEAMESLGLVKVRGALGGTYYE
jgi:hypothetical protein